MSPTHFRFGVSEVKARFTRSGNFGLVLSCRVSPLRRLIRRATRPWRRMESATVFSDTTHPSSSRSACSRGEPCRPRAFVNPTRTARSTVSRRRSTAGSWWSIHELNLRTVAGSAEPGRPGAGLVAATGRLPDGTWVGGYYNAGSTAAEVPWPIDGFGYTYRLPPTAAVTFALPGTQVTSHQTRRTGFHPGEAGHGITHR